MSCGKEISSANGRCDGCPGAEASVESEGAELPDQTPHVMDLVTGFYIPDRSVLSLMVGEIPTYVSVVMIGAFVLLVALLAAAQI